MTRRLAALAAAPLFLLASALRAAEPAPAPAAAHPSQPAAPPDADTALPPAAPLPPLAPGARTVADTSLVLSSDQGTRTLSNVLGDDEWRLIQQINATPGTYQDYLLYTSEDLPDVFFHPGYVITFGPPRKKAEPPAATPPGPAPAGPSGAVPATPPATPAPPAQKP